jgi:hypothetical protein
MIPKLDLVAHGIQTHAIGAGIEHAIAHDIETDIVIRTEVTRHPILARLQLVQNRQRPRITAYFGEGRRGIATDITGIEIIGIRLPVIGNDAEAQALGHASHDARAGKQVQEHSLGGVDLGKFHRLLQ